MRSGWEGNCLWHILSLPEDRVNEKRLGGTGGRDKCLAELNIGYLFGSNSRFDLQDILAFRVSISRDKMRLWNRIALNGAADASM